MKKVILSGMLVVACSIPSLAMAKGVPLFFNTGDELFEIDGAPEFDDGYKVGYACQRFGLFGADVWTWDCDLMAVNLEEFSAGDLPAEMKAELSARYTVSDRKRGPWNHYGAFGLVMLVAGFTVVRAKK